MVWTRYSFFQYLDPVGLPSKPGGASCKNRARGIIRQAKRIHLLDSSMNAVTAGAKWWGQFGHSASCANQRC